MIEEKTAEQIMFNKILGSLKQAIDAHGEITLKNYTSAAKRIYGQLVNNA